MIPLGGFNPSGTLHIGTSNTGEVNMGPIKIDNTVVPSQLFIKNITPIPTINPADTNIYDYYLTSNATGNKDTLQNINSFTPSTATANPGNKVVSLGKSRSEFLLIYGGGYEIEFKVEGSPLLSVYLVVKNRQSVLDFKTGLYLEEDSKIPNSNIIFTSAESSKTIKFNIYAKSAKTLIYFGTDSLTDIMLKTGSYIKIKQISYIIEAPVPPIDSTPHLYKLKSDFSVRNNSILNTLQFNNEDNNGIVTVNTYENGGQNNIFTLVEGGEYEFNIKLKVQNTDDEETIQGASRTQSVYLTPQNDSIVSVTGSSLSIGAPIENVNPLYNSRLDFVIGLNSVGTYYQGEIIKCLIYSQPGGTLRFKTDTRNYSNNLTYQAQITFIQANTVITIKHISKVVPSKK